MLPRTLRMLRTGALALLLAASASADVFVLKDGRRIQGTLAHFCVASIVVECAERTMVTLCRPFAFRDRYRWPL